MIRLEIDLTDMNLIALLLGVLIAAFIIIYFHKTRLECGKFAYVYLLFSFPFYYFFFAFYGNDYRALTIELIAGLIFFFIAIKSLKLTGFIKFKVLAIGFIGHGVYDAIHNHLFSNAGIPLWWPEFCGIIDIMIGLYLIWLAFQYKESHA